MKRLPSLIVALLALSVLVAPLSVGAQTKTSAKVAPKVATTTSVASEAPEVQVLPNQQGTVIVGVTVDDVAGYVENNTYKGSATLINEGDTQLTDIYIEAMTLSEVVDSQYTNFFAPQRFGPFSMLPRESTKISFAYKLPDVLYGSEPVIMLRATYLKGDTLGFSMTPLEVPANPNMKAPVDLQGSSLEYHDKVYSAQEGPTVGAEDIYKAHLTLNLKDVLSSKLKVQPKVKLTPRVIVYDRVVNNTKVGERSLETIEITANKKSEVYLDLSGIVKKPGVYEARIQLIDEEGIDRSEFIGIRYIVEGRIFTLKDLTVDYLPVKKGDRINAYVYFAGTPLNIVSEATPKNGTYTFQTKLYSADGVLIAENAKQIDADAVDSAMIELFPTATYYGKAKLELKVLDQGVLYAERTIDLDIPRGEQSQVPFFVLLGVALLFLVITMVAFKKGQVYIAIVAFLLAAAAAGYAIYTDIAYATIVYTEKTPYKPEKGTLHGPNVSISITDAKGKSKASDLKVGDTFYASAIVESSLCLNLDASISISIGGVTKSVNRKGNIDNHANSQMRLAWKFGAYTAKTEGNKNLPFIAKSAIYGHPQHGTIVGTSFGYKKYTVNPVTTTSSYTCPNGTVVTNPVDCPSTVTTTTTTGGYMCSNGVVVVDPALCPTTTVPATSTLPVVTPVCDNDNSCEMGETLGACDCKNVCDMSKVGQSCSTNSCTGETDGTFVCTYSGLMCQQTPGFTCNLGQIRKFEANPRDVNQGGRCTLSWETENMKSCTIRDNDGTVLSASTTLPDGSVQTDPITKTKRYTLECIADDDSIQSAPAECRLNVQFIQF